MFWVVRRGQDPRFECARLRLRFRYDLEDYGTISEAGWGDLGVKAYGTSCECFGYLGPHFKKLMMENGWGCGIGFEVGVRRG